MKTQVVYEINCDFEASEENLRKSGLVCSNLVEPTGQLFFRFKETETAFLLFHTGKLQVRWRNPEEKKILFKLVKNLLKPKDGEYLKIRPLHQTPEIPYPVPEPFKLYWCDEITEYTQLRQPKTGDIALDQVLVQAETAYHHGDYPRAFDSWKHASKFVNLDDATKLIRETELRMKMTNEYRGYTMIDTILTRRKFFYGEDGFMKQQCDKLHDIIIPRLQNVHMTDKA